MHQAEKSWALVSVQNLMDSFAPLCPLFSDGTDCFLFFLDMKPRASKLKTQWPKAADGKDTICTWLFSEIV